MSVLISSWGSESMAACAVYSSRDSVIDVSMSYHCNQLFRTVLFFTDINRIPDLVSQTDTKDGWRGFTTCKVRPARSSWFLIKSESFSDVAFAAPIPVYLGLWARWGQRVFQFAGGWNAMLLHRITGFSPFRRWSKLITGETCAWIPLSRAKASISS